MMQKTEPRCLGMRITYDPKSSGIAENRGVWRWKRIVVGPAFHRLTPRERQAVLLHEAGHAKLRHTERRILPLAFAILTHPRLLWHALMSPDARVGAAHWNAFIVDSGMAEFAQQQEYQADAFVRGCGYGSDLAQVFLRFGSGGGLHPSLQSRLERLMPKGA